MFKFSKSKAMLMTAITAAPMMASTVTTVHAASINNNTVVKDTFKANSVATVRKAMQAQGLNVNDVNGKYIVRAGDTLSVIAEAAHMTVAQIAKENNISNVDMIYIGQVLFLNAGVDTNVNKGVANNPVVSDNIANTTIGTGAAAIMNSANNTYNYVGNGNSVALPSKTTSQMQASALANSGVNINNHANNTASAVNNGTTNKAVNTNNDTVNNTPVANHTNSANGNHVTTGTSHATSAVNNNHVNSAASTTSAAASTASQSQATSNANKPASTASQASQTASVAPSAAPSQATSAASQSSQASQSTTNYADGVVYPNGQINYQAAINQKGPWNNMTGDQAFQTWEQDHMSNGSVPYTAATGYADGSKSQIPMYGNGKGSITSPDINNKNSVNNPMGNQYRPIFNQQQCDQINQQIQKDTPASTFGDGIQWVSSNYNGTVTGKIDNNIDTPVATPYQNTIDHAAQIDSNVLKQGYQSGSSTAPAGSKYVSSTVTQGYNALNGSNAQSNVDGYNTNVVHLTFYK